MPRTIEAILVKTFLGTRLYPQDTRVYASAGGKGLFFKTYVSDLNERELILWHRKSIDTTFEEIEPYLLESHRYARAEQALFAINKQGKKVPKLRIELIKALAAQGIIPGENLEQKIMKEGEDFTHEEYAAMTNFLHQQIQQTSQTDQAPTREPVTIKAWLQGTTIGPQHPNMLYSLALATNSKTVEEWFMGANKNATSSTGFWGAYKLYVILRQNVTKIIAGEIRGSSHRNHGHSEKNGIDTSPEAELIMRHFVQEVDDKIALAKVLEVKKVEIPVGDWDGRKSILANGAYTGEQPPESSAVKLDQLVAEKNFFTAISGYAISDYLMGIASGRYSANEKAQEAITMLKKGELEALGGKVLESFLLRTALSKQISLAVLMNLDLLEVKDFKPKLSFGYMPLDVEVRGKKVLAEVVKNLADHITDNILLGRMDSELGLPEKTVYSFFEAISRLDGCLPQIYKDYQVLFNKLHIPGWSRLERRDLENRLDRASRKITGRYGAGQYDGAYELFLLSFIAGASQRAVAEKADKELHDLPFKSGKLIEMFEDFLNPDLMKENDIAQGSKLRKGLFTRKRSLEILTRYSMPELMKFIPESNFAFDHEQEPTAQ